MVCEGFIQPLDLECLFVNTLAGSYEIFLALAFIAIAVIAGKFRMLNITVGIMYGLFIVLTSILFNGWLMLLVLVVGFAFAIVFSRMLKQ